MQTIVDMYKESAKLWEILDHVEDEPNYVIEMLRRKNLLRGEILPSGEIDKIKKKLNTRLPFKTPSDKASMPVGLEKWCCYYGFGLEVAAKAIIAKEGEIYELFQQDALNWKRIRTERINKKYIEQEERFKSEGYPLGRMRDSLCLTSFADGDEKNPIFDKTDGTYWLKLQVHGTGLKLRKPFSSLIWALRGIQANQDGTYPLFGSGEVCYEQETYEGDVHLALDLDLIAELNSTNLKNAVRSWGGKYCYVLDKFFFSLSQITMDPGLDLQALIDQKLEEGER